MNYSFCRGAAFCLLILFLTLNLSACTNEPSEGLPEQVRNSPGLVLFERDAEAEYRIDITREEIFTDSLLLNQISGVAIHPDGGPLFSGRSWNREEIFRFSPDGELLYRSGNGDDAPYRFGRIGRLEMNGNTLSVFDREREAVVRLSGDDLGLIEEITLAENPRSNREVSDNGSGEQPVAEPMFSVGENGFLIRMIDGRSPVYHDDRERRYHLFSAEGRIVKNDLFTKAAARYLIGDYSGRPAPFQLIHPETPLEAPHPDGMITADSEEFFVRLRDAKGAVIRSWYVPVERAELDAQSTIDEFGHNLQLRRVRESADYPESWPALNSILSDENGRVWVSVVTGFTDETEWRVIDDDRLVATFSWLQENPILYVGENHFYTSENDATGFQDLVRYRFEFGDR